MTDPFATAADLAYDMLGGEPTDAVRLVSADGSVTHLPDPGPVDPYMLWEGELTPAWQAWLRRGNGPYWLEGDGVLVISQDTDTPDEDNLRARPGEWVTWCGPGHGFENGRVMPVFMRCGWEAAEVRVGWVQAPGQMPALLRSMAAAWRTTAAAEPTQDEYERVNEACCAGPCTDACGGYGRMLAADTRRQMEVTVEGASPELMRLLVNRGEGDK